MHGFGAIVSVLLVLPYTLGCAPAQHMVAFSTALQWHAHSNYCRHEQALTLWAETWSCVNVLPARPLMAPFELSCYECYTVML